jgi:hypothetical protein
VRRVTLDPEAIQHWWAALGLVGLGFVASFGRVYELYPPTTVVGFLLHLLTVVVIGGFYATMFLDCVRYRTRHRLLWIALFVVLPILSAYIYFMVTRSSYYSRRRSGEEHR